MPGTCTECRHQPAWLATVQGLKGLIFDTDTEDSDTVEPAPESPASPNSFDSDLSDLSQSPSEPSDCDANQELFLGDFSAFGEKKRCMPMICSLRQVANIIYYM